MTRRVYETAEDRQREDWVMGKVSKYLGLRYKRASKFSSYDGELADLNGIGIKITAIVEVKCRTTNKHDHPTLIVAKKKIDAGRKLAKKRGLAYMLAVRWMDVISWLRINTDDTYEVSIAGRTDRNDKADMEPCYLIPVQAFTDLPT